MYREHPPAGSPGDLRCVWVYEGGAEAEPQRIAPDGCCELIVHLGDPYTELPEGARQPAILFAGQLTRPFAIRAAGPAAVLGVRFEPDGARGFFGRSPAAATDARVDLSAVHGDLLRDLRAAADWEARVGIAQAYVAARSIAPDALVRAAVGGLTRGEAISHGALSERQFERRFKDRVGVSARMLAAIFRFRRVFDAVERPERPGWVEAALAAGYFDQPQMARDFRRFLGCTASAWARQQAGLARALTAPENYKHAAAVHD